MPPWITLVAATVAILATIAQVLLAIDRWVHRQATEQLRTDYRLDGSPSMGQRLGVVESELLRARQRLHDLEQWRQSFGVATEMSLRENEKEHRRFQRQLDREWRRFVEPDEDPNPTPPRSS